jgi:uncharacterized membrane protein
MSTSADTIAKSKNSRGILSVTILTWMAVALFLIAFLLAPQGITVLWSGYLLLFGPVIVVDLAAIVGFIVCRLMRRKISFAYLLMSLFVMGGVWYITWFALRLRWYELFS